MPYAEIIIYCLTVLRLIFRATLQNAIPNNAPPTGVVALKNNVKTIPKMTNEVEL
jgi:hypothetical protein